MVAIIYEFNGKQYVSATTYIKLEQENKKLKEFKAKQEEMMFLIGASIELAKPKTARDAEKLQKGKELYEKLYKEELYSLKEENKKLKDDLLHYIRREEEYREENKKLKESEKRYKNQCYFYVECIRKLEQENKKLKNSKICGKTVEERIEIDEGVIRDEDKSGF